MKRAQQNALHTAGHCEAADKAAAFASNHEWDARETRKQIEQRLHEPSVKLKDLAGTPKGERLAEALRHLYDLED